MDIQEIKLNKEVNVCLLHWRTLLSEHRIPSWFNYRNMEDRLCLELLSHQWYGQVEQLSTIVGNIEREFGV